MKCLLKTVISLVVIILIAAAVMYFWGIPTLLGEDNATEHLEKQDYTVVVTDISLTEDVKRSSMPPRARPRPRIP